MSENSGTLRVFDVVFFCTKLGCSGSLATLLLFLELESRSSSLDLYRLIPFASFDLPSSKNSLPSRLSSSNSSKLDDFLSIIGKVLKDFSSFLALICFLRPISPAEVVVGSEFLPCSRPDANDVGLTFKDTLYCDVSFAGIAAPFDLRLDLKTPLISFFVFSFAEWMEEVTFIRVPLTYLVVPWSVLLSL